MKQRIISLILCLALMLGCTTCLTAITSSAAVVETSPVCATQNQLNMVSRADYMFNSTWVCQKTVQGWGGTFYKGSTYRIPYGQPVTTGKYVGFDAFAIDESTFKAATQDPDSIFYTQRSSYSGQYSTYYANDCSAFVSYCWGLSRHTTATLPNKSTNLGKATEANIRSNLQLGDALNYSGSHVVIVTGITYSGSTMTQIEITEQTPPQLKRSYYTPAALASKYSSKYSILRYSGEVPSAPSGDGVESSHPLESNSTHQKLKNVVFNAQFYYSRYEDLQTAIGLDEEKLYDHFLNNGIKEGRCASPYFDVKYYMTQNDSGLITHCNGDYMVAYEHFLQYVEDPNEMLGTPKKLSPIFDINYYKNSHIDLRDIGWTTEYEYLMHFVNSGVNEWRQGSAEFDPVCYAYNNDDVFAVYGAEYPNEYYRHYMCHGIIETSNENRAKITEYENYGSTFYATISEINTGKVLEYVPQAATSSYDDGNAVVINTANSSDSQLWRFDIQSDGSYKITNVAYNKLIDLRGEYLGATDKIEDINESLQNWKILNKGGNCILKSSFGGQTFDVAISYEDYSPVKIWTFNGGANQQFRINLVSEDYGDKFRATINTVIHGAYVLTDDDTNNVVVNVNSGEDSELWDFERLSDGTYKIINVKSGKALTADSDIFTSDYSGLATQKWIFVAEPYDSISIRSLSGISDNVAMDLYGILAGQEIPANSKICVSDYTCSDSQRFEIKKVAVQKGLLGDTNGDSVVSVMDATKIQFAVAQLSTLSADETLRADVDADGTLSVVDATYVQQYIAQIDTDFDIGKMIEAI